MEETLPPQTESGAGFEPVRVRQFTIFLENKVGRLQTLVRAMEESDLKIMALAIEESGDAALVRMICSFPDKTRHILKTEGFTYTETDLLVVELPKRAKHPMIAVCSALLAAEINIHYAYPMLQRPRGPALVLYVDDYTLAAQLLIRKGYNLLGESDLG